MLHTYQYKLGIVAIVDCTHVGSTTASFKDLVTLHWRTLPTADILIEDQLWPPLDMVEVDQERTRVFFVI